MAPETITEEKIQTPSQNTQPQDVQAAALLFMMETMRDLKNEIAELRKAQTAAPQNGAEKGSGAGRPRAQGSPHIDTKTGKVYKSKASAGKTLFPEFEGRQLNDGRVVKMHGWIFHDIVALEPGRLIPYTGTKGHGEVDEEYVLEHVVKTEEPKTEETKSEEPKTEQPAAQQTQQKPAGQGQQQNRPAQQQPVQNQPKK